MKWVSVSFLFLLALSSLPLLRGAPAPTAVQYVFVPDTQRFVALRCGDTFSIGKLDRNGVFWPDRRWVDVKSVGPKVPPHALLNELPGPAYEYRARRLILGRLDKDGYFIPDLDSEIISLEDYVPGPKAIRIYNLPGRFVKREKQEEGK